MADDSQTDFFKALAETLIRVWAAGTIIFCLTTLVHFSFATWAKSEGGERFIFESFASVLLQLAVAVFFWFSARNFAKWIVPKSTHTRLPENFTITGFLTVGCMLIGIFYLVEYLPRAMLALAELFARAASEEKDLSNLFDPLMYSSLLSNWLAVFFALLLAFRARDIARMFSWLRRAGQNVDEDERPEK